MNKRMRWLALLLALLMMPLYVPAESAVTEPAPSLYLNAGDNRPLYESADPKAEVLRQLMAGEAFELQRLEGGWALIRVFTESGQMETGWGTGDNLRPKTPEDGYRHGVVAPVKGKNPVLRTAPRSNADSLGQYFPGVVGRVLAQPDKGWVKLSIGSLEGFMQAEALAFDPMPDSIADVLPQVSVAYQDGPSLTMRGAQSFKSDKIGAYRNGTQMKVLGFTDDFAQVIGPDGKLGFMMAWGLDPQPYGVTSVVSGGETETPDQIPPQQELTQPAHAYTTTINNTGGEGAHLRKKSSASSETQGLYKNGTQVYVLKYGEYWCKIWVDGKEGYMMTKLLQSSDNRP